MNREDRSSRIKSIVASLNEKDDVGSAGGSSGGFLRSAPTGGSDVWDGVSGGIDEMDGSMDAS